MLNIKSLCNVCAALDHLGVEDALITPYARTPYVKESHRVLLDGPVPLSFAAAHQGEIRKRLEEKEPLEKTYRLCFDDERFGGTCFIDSDRRVEVFKSLELAYKWRLATDGGMYHKLGMSLSVIADGIIEIRNLLGTLNAAHTMDNENMVKAAHNVLTDRMQRHWKADTYSRTGDGYLSAMLHFWTVYTQELGGERFEYPVKFLF